MQKVHLWYQDGENAVCVSKYFHIPCHIEIVAFFREHEEILQDSSQYLRW